MLVQKLSHVYSFYMYMLHNGGIDVSSWRAIFCWFSVLLQKSLPNSFLKARPAWLCFCLQRSRSLTSLPSAKAAIRVPITLREQPALHRLRSSFRVAQQLLSEPRVSCLLVLWSISLSFSCILPFMAQSALSLGRAGIMSGCYIWIFVISLERKKREAPWWRRACANSPSRSALSIGAARGWARSGLCSSWSWGADQSPDSEARSLPTKTAQIAVRKADHSPVGPKCQENRLVLREAVLTVSFACRWERPRCSSAAYTHQSNRLLLLPRILRAPCRTLRSTRKNGTCLKIWCV